MPWYLSESEDGEIRALGKFYDIYLRHTEEENVLDFSSIQTETQIISLMGWRLYDLFAVLSDAGCPQAMHAMLINKVAP